MKITNTLDLQEFSLKNVAIPLILRSKELPNNSQYAKLHSETHVENTRFVARFYVL